MPTREFAKARETEGGGEESLLTGWEGNEERGWVGRAYRAST